MTLRSGKHFHRFSYDFSWFDYTYRFNVYGRLVLPLIAYMYIYTNIEKISSLKKRDHIIFLFSRVYWGLLTREYLLKLNFEKVINDCVTFCVQLANQNLKPCQNHRCCYGPIGPKVVTFILKIGWFVHILLSFPRVFLIESSGNF